MLNQLLRRYQQPLLIVFTVFIIISFVGFFNGGFIDKVGNDAAGMIYGRSVPQVQLLRGVRSYELSRGLQMNDLVKALCDVPGIPEEMMSMYQLPPKYENEFTWNLMVLRHEAERLGIGSTQAERDEAIKQMPVFQTNGAFDSSKLNNFIANALSPRGLTPEAFEDLVADQLMLRKLLALLGATTAPAPADVRAAYDQHYRKTESTVVRFKFDEFLAAATTTDDEVKKLYEDRKSQLKSDEMRKVQVAGFTLPAAEKPLEGKERAEALGKLGKAAEEFSIALTEKDAKFDEAAAKAGVKVEETPEFSRSAPPPALATVPAAAGAAFKLTTKEPNSDIITSDKGYYVLHLTGVTEARPLTFDEAKTQLVEQLKREHAQEALNLKATEVRNKIDAEMKAGKSFADAAQAAGVKAEPFPVFSQSDANRTLPDAQEIMSATAELKEGELSPFTQSGSGGLLVHVNKRLPADDAKFATDKVLIGDSLARQTRATLFSEWLKARRAEAHIQTARRS